MIIYIFSLINTIIDTCHNIFLSGKKAINAGLDSQKPDIWVFLQKNSIPWITKSNVHGVHSFSPDTNVFYNTSLNDPIKRGLEDVVTAEIVDSNGIMVLDATETFHSLRWSSLPSIYEIILILFLSKGYLLSDTVIHSYSIRLMSLASLDEPMLIPLRHSKIKERFTGWDVFLKPSGLLAEPREDS